MSEYIKKINKKNVETFLGVKLIPNLVVIGADTAVYHTAFAIIRTTDTYLILESLEKIEVPKLAKKSTTEQVLNNVNLYTEQLDALKNKLAMLYHFDILKIEDCYYAFSIKTTKSLAYNSILTYDRLKRICTNSTLIMPNSARAKVHFKKSKKKMTKTEFKNEIIEYVNLALGLEITNNDEADSIVLALSGLCEEVK